MNGSAWRLEGGPYPHAEKQIVVGLPQLNLVERELRAKGVAYKKAATSRLLDLALLEVTDPNVAAAELRREKVEDPLELHGDSIDGVLAALRSGFSSRYAGWAPVMGKNRLVGRLHGTREVIHSGGGDPLALQAPLSPPDRSSGPGGGVRVGLLDTALFPQRWLAGGWSARYSDRLPTDSVPPFAAGHATFAAGLILSQAPGATVEARRVLKKNGTAASWDVAEEIVRLGRSGVDVMNLSFACYTEDGQPPLVLSTAVDRINPDVVVVAAAGNHGEVPDPANGVHARSPQSAKPAWPAALEDVIAVGAVDRHGKRAPFSPDAAWVDVHAVGVKVRSTYPPKAEDRSKNPPVQEFRDGWAEWDGTSFSAALVSGAIAAATEPGRVTAREAAQDLLRTLRRDRSPEIDSTGAKFLRLPLW